MTFFHDLAKRSEDGTLKIKNVKQRGPPHRKPAGAENLNESYDNTDDITRNAVNDVGIVLNLHLSLIRANLYGISYTV